MARIETSSCLHLMEYNWRYDGFMVGLDSKPAGHSLFFEDKSFCGAFQLMELRILLKENRKQIENESAGVPAFQPVGKLLQVAKEV